jgi:hypothetical protein
MCTTKDCYLNEGVQTKLMIYISLSNKAHNHATKDKRTSKNLDFEMCFALLMSMHMLMLVCKLLPYACCLLCERWFLVWPQ